jgi:hypothetical protein
MKFSSLATLCGFMISGTAVFAQPPETKPAGDYRAAGEALTLGCGADEYVGGLRVFTGDTMDNVDVYCVRLDDSGRWNGVPLRSNDDKKCLKATAQGIENKWCNIRGVGSTDGGRYRTVQVCPMDMVAIGYRSTTITRYGNYVGAIALRCATIGRSIIHEFDMSPIANRESIDGGVSDCPAGYVAVAVKAVPRAISGTASSDMRVATLAFRCDRWQIIAKTKVRPGQLER